MAGAARGGAAGGGAAARILNGLNANQREAVEFIDGPLLIVAGPGSGKTRVITHRIAYLARVVGVSPHRIAAVTFTNKAAREMRARLSALLGQSADRLTASTFHAFCARALRRDGEGVGLSRDFSIYDDADQMALMKRVLEELELDPKRFPPRSILSAISGAKSVLLGAEGFAGRTASYWDEVVARAYERYEELLGRSSAVDFDDLLLKTYLMFERLPDVAARYQERYAHFMVDEFQDTNVAQYAIAKQIARLHHNICVVGDPDQSIYAWRNADIRNILSFQDDYPRAKLIALDQNYRSTQNILDAARSLIAANTQRVNTDKGLWTDNGDGARIVLAEGYNEEEEAQFVAREALALARGGRYALGDMAVMYRVNAQSRALEESCLRYGIPYQVVGGMKFYQRQEVKDVTAYLRLVANPDDDAGFARAVNAPARGIGQRTLDLLARTARAAGMSQFGAVAAIADGRLSPGAVGISGDFAKRPLAALVKFRELIGDIAAQRDSLDLQDLIDEVVERSGYARALEGQDGGDDRMDNIRELRASALDYLTLGRGESLTAFLESVSLVADVDSMEDKADALTLITLHQAKGLEFRAVFMVGMEEGLLPHSRSQDDPEQVEEERRLCYVGVTRAKERLYLLRAFRRGFRGGSEPGTPSRFLMDIPPELLAAPEQRGAGAKGAGRRGDRAATERPQRAGGPEQPQRAGRPGQPQRTGRPDGGAGAPRSISDMTRAAGRGGAVGRDRAAGRQGGARSERLTRLGAGAGGASRAAGASGNAGGRRTDGGGQGRGGASVRRQTSGGANALPGRGAAKVGGKGRGEDAGPAPAWLRTGDKVRHKTFGEGIVTECKPSGGDYEVTVAFKDGAGVKRLLLGIAPLEKAD